MWSTIALRAFVALPLIPVGILCLTWMNPDRVAAHQKPYVNAGKIEWDDGASSIQLLDHFYSIEWMDDMWKAVSVTFSAATLGFDPVSAWQFFTFAIDLGPLYTAWLLESTRPVNAWTPAYFPTIITCLAQVLGIGSIGPIFYFLIFAFGPSAASLASTSDRSRRLAQSESGAPMLLPLVLALHTAEVFLMFKAPEPETRHYWTWAWQMSPLWIGVANVAFSMIGVRAPVLSSKEVTLSVLGVISTGVWIYTLVFCPFSLAEVFLPGLQDEPDYLPHTRRIYQFDQLAAFAASFLWMLYDWVDRRRAGLIKELWWRPIVDIPLATIFLGPGSAFALYWYRREKNLEKYSQ